MGTCNTYIKDEMRRQGISQVTLGDMLGLDQSSVCRMLNNNREMRIGELIKIAEILHISDRELAKIVAADAAYRRTQPAPPNISREPLHIVDKADSDED